MLPRGITTKGFCSQKELKNKKFKKEQKDFKKIKKTNLGVDYFYNLNLI